MNNEENILDILLHMQSDVSDLKTDVSGLKADVSGLKCDVAELKTDVADLKIDVTGLKTDVIDLKTDVTSLKTDVAVLKIGQDRLSHTMISLENELVPKVTALFDGYTLRGEQMDNLKAHFDERFKGFQEDITYLLSKPADKSSNLLPYQGR